VPDDQEFPVPRQSDATKAAIKNAIDIVALVGEHLPLRRTGSKYKALCPFHDDHNPSLEVNPERQSFKCWGCGVGGDVFDFVKIYEKVDFAEALRMLAERAGIELERPTEQVRGDAARPSRTELLAVLAWAEERFCAAFSTSSAARSYVQRRGLDSATVERFRLGYAPLERGWMLSEARGAGIAVDLLEQAGLVARADDSSGLIRERFRGRLIFPIHDEQGRPIGFGGRILPEAEQVLTAQGKSVAKYLNSPETPLFQKRRVLYSANLARAAARELGWVAVVEGYTDVMAAHQVGFCNVVATLGTALGAEHVQGLRRLAERVVLVFDGDPAGQLAADRALEFFIAHQLDVRIVNLPAGRDPCDFLLAEGAEAFRGLVERAADPLTFVLERARLRFDLGSIEGVRRAAEWVLELLSRSPVSSGIGMDLKVAKALDSLAQRLGLPVDPLRRRLAELKRSARKPQPASLRPSNHIPTTVSAAGPEGGSSSPGAGPGGLLGNFDPLDRELVEVVLNEPTAVSLLASRVAVSELRDPSLRAILQVCYDLREEGDSPSYEKVMLRLDDPQARAVAAALILPIDPAPLPAEVRPAPWRERLEGVLVRLAERERQRRLRDLRQALMVTNAASEPEAHRALQLEHRRLMNQRPDTILTRPDPSFRG
jgi:DNA primase